ncbi:MAG: UDP-N-acetylmuramoyl-tripeptide--D-alanyl-D-alanine ligase [Chloroflexi bacterium]|nr:UDP-N-acetylmuramoyl-tripeptide--D-alanyl-D-alanine ligase [Chloroflexota bacterium]
MTDALPRSWRGATEPAFTAAELVSLTGGRLLRAGARPIRRAAVDSRSVTPGCLFVALPGERTDGHAHVADAAAAGAAAILVTRRPDDDVLERLGDVTVIEVPDGVRALGALAADWRARFAPLVVGVTGSIAKTSTKEAIATVLDRRFSTLRSEGNRNNEIGLPLTLLDLGPEHEAAVLEMGMYVGGEIADLAAMARPSIGVVTAVEPVHLSRIGTLEAVERAKGELVEALPPDGAAVLNADDPRVVRMAGRTVARAVTYGFSAAADVRAETVVSRAADGMRFVLRTPAGSRPVLTAALGRHGVHNALAAAAVGLAAGVDLDEIAAGLAGGWSAPHRDRLVRVGSVTILDDSYNASPASMTAALDLLATLPGRRRIAVLGEMLELGDTHEAGHRAVGAVAARIVDLLVVVGAGATPLAEAAREHPRLAGRVLQASDALAALALLRPLLEAGDVVLVKGSRGIALEAIVDTLAAEAGA